MYTRAIEFPDASSWPCFQKQSSFTRDARLAPVYDDVVTDEGNRESRGREKKDFER